MDRKHETLLINAAQHGNAQAFTELYNAYVNKVYLYIYYRVFVVAVAEDLTADVFLKALEGLSSYEDRSTPLLAWLYRIAHARVVDYFRSLRYRAFHQNIDEVEIGIDDEMDTSLITKQQVEIVQAALKKLSAEHQQIIIIRFIEGNNLETAAELLGKSVAAIKSLQFRATQALAKVLQEQGFEVDEYTT